MLGTPYRKIRNESLILYESSRISMHSRITRSFVQNLQFGFQLYFEIASFEKFRIFQNAVGFLKIFRWNCQEFK